MSLRWREYNNTWKERRYVGEHESGKAKCEDFGRVRER